MNIMDLVNAVPLIVWIVLGFSALAGIVVTACIMFFNGLFHYDKAVKLDGLNHNIDAAEERLKELRAERDNLRDELVKAQQTIDSAKAEREWLEEHESVLEAKKGELARIDGDIKSLQEKKEKIQEDVGKEQNRVNELAKEAQKAEAEKRIAEAAKQDAETQRGTILKDIERHSTELKELKDKIAAAETELERIQKEISGLREKEAHVEDLRRQIKELEEQKKKLEAELKNATETLATTRAQAIEAQGILDRLTFVRNEQENIWADLEMPIIPQKGSQRKKSDSAETVWLETLTTELNSAGFQFNPRIINAFHTGLKCGDMTPLVVLAGISGTGKSLLPELYAAAAGMNFLAVPIQPRWDSPQDLFGFFNYMEGRYKATELARFLWQIDRYNNKEKSLNDDSLSIVLLDEMNLARVEYYFSDLLSKLEMRRGLNPDNKDERAKAEIIIEGNAGEKGSSHRLFVGSDVFFIGTMNEDETTQMLSDKVVDRSNIMRFGRPERMAMAPDKGAVLKAFAKTPRLTKTRWSDWKARGRMEHAGSFGDVAKEPLNRLNAAFESIGRPFGHRVWQAVESYITHYPVMNVGGESFTAKTAFADQLEMKILPKLNGIELSAQNVSQVMADVRGVLRNLGDERLQQAFEAAVDPNVNTFFRWRGVMR